MPLSALGRGDMEWSEAFLLIRTLVKDPTSRLFIARQGWKYPWSREANILADLYDALVALNVDKKQKRLIKPYRRPWPDADKDSTTSRPAAHLTQAQIRAALAKGAPRRD